MLRIIDGQVFEGKPSADRWTITEHRLGNGHVEACIQRCVDWEHSGPLDPDSICAQVLRGEREDPDAQEKAEANLRRAARRAKTKVRRLCKFMGVDCLLTLTYRENQTDLALCKKHFAAFVRRCRTLMPGFGYVAAFEEQGRGAWHVHMGVQKLPKDLPARNGVKVKSYNVLRAVWRSVVGEYGGTINGQNAKPWHSPGRLASYLSKYLLKAFESGEAGSNRYSATAVPIPKAERIEVRSRELPDMIGVLYASMPADADLFTWLARWGDVFYMSYEVKSPLRKMWEARREVA